MYLLVMIVAVEGTQYIVEVDFPTWFKFFFYMGFLLSMEKT